MAPILGGLVTNQGHDNRGSVVMQIRMRGMSQTKALLTEVVLGEDGGNSGSVGDLAEEETGRKVEADAKSAVVSTDEEEVEEAKTKLSAEAGAEGKAEMEAKAKGEADANAVAEAVAKAKAEIEAQAKVVVKAKAEREAQAKAEADAKALAEAEAKALAEAVAKAKAEMEAKAEADAKAVAEAVAKAAAEVEAKDLAEAEAKALAEAVAKAKAEMEAKAEADAKALAEAVAQAKAEVEAQAKAEADAKALAETARLEVATDQLHTEEETVREESGLPEQKLKRMSQVLNSVANNASFEGRQHFDQVVEEEEEREGTPEQKGRMRALWGKLYAVYGMLGARKANFIKPSATNAPHTQSAAPSASSSLSPRDDPSNQMSIREKAKAEADAKALTQADMQVKALAQAKAEAEAEAKALVQAKAFAEAEAKSLADALAEAKALVEAQTVMPPPAKSDPPEISEEMKADAMVFNWLGSTLPPMQESPSSKTEPRRYGRHSVTALSGPGGLSLEKFILEDKALAPSPRGLSPRDFSPCDSPRSAAGSSARSSLVNLAAPSAGAEEEASRSVEAGASQLLEELVAEGLARHQEKAEEACAQSTAWHFETWEQHMRKSVFAALCEVSQSPGPDDSVRFPDIDHDDAM
eukprot:gene27230-33530_t